MLAKKGGNAFPYTIFMDHEGVVLTDEWFFPGDEQALGGALATAKAVQAELEDLRAKAVAAPDDAAAQAALELALALRPTNEMSPERFAEIKAIPGVPAKLVERFEVKALVAEMNATQERVGKAAREANLSRDEYFAKVAEAMFELYRSGRRLPHSHGEATTLYGYSMDHALSVGDVDSAKAAFADFELAMKHIAETQPDYADRVKKQLEQKRQQVFGADDPAAN